MKFDEIDELKKIERSKAFTVFEDINSHFNKLSIIIDIIRSLNNQELRKDFLKYIEAKIYKIKKKIGEEMEE